MYIKENEQRYKWPLIWYKTKLIALVLIIVLVIYLLTQFITDAMAGEYSATQYQTDSFNLYLNQANDPLSTFNSNLQEQRVLDTQRDLQIQIDDIKEEREWEEFEKSLEEVE